MVANEGREHLVGTEITNQMQIILALSCSLGVLRYFAEKFVF